MTVAEALEAAAVARVVALVGAAALAMAMEKLVRRVRAAAPLGRDTGPMAAAWWAAQESSETAVQAVAAAVAAEWAVTVVA